MNLRAGLPQGLAVVVLDNSGACVLQGRNVSFTASHGAKILVRFILFGSKVTVRPPLAKCKKFAPRNQNGIFAGYSMQPGGRWKDDYFDISFGQLIVRTAHQSPQADRSKERL